MAYKFKRFSVCVTDSVYERMINISNTTGESLARVTRDLIEKGLATNYIAESEDIIANIVREQLQLTLKPSVERLAKIASKAGHMSATAAFLNVQALMDLVPDENKKDVRLMYEKARKKAATYMKQKAEDFENNLE
ncbi:hypothetical protein KTC96_25100 (plasmid) [Clostridium estertheticum]|uniref:hypothetical protein n=1 Tax=Clostridium estertheticum TaxID=238834 RepID=UPI001C7CE3A8|nr:hypothetical protein [Clostridium estertheticum]MBX4262535.1 hypothetical protein [Clostridium estertheticum]WLC73353.1 hypothetical protein KTC96_25100 [Clostridium estertheticum]